MIQNQRTTDSDVIDYKQTLLDALLAAKAEGQDIDDLIRVLQKSIKRAMLREKRERAA
jgi:uncharacterized protein YybS (DUF2232 family)